MEVAVATPGAVVVRGSVLATLARPVRGWKLLINQGIADATEATIYAKDEQT
jgi:hypothetical protein